MLMSNMLESSCCQRNHGRNPKENLRFSKSFSEGFFVFLVIIMKT